MLNVLNRLMMKQKNYKLNNVAARIIIRDVPSAYSYYLDSLTRKKEKLKICSAIGVLNASLLIF